MPLERPIIQGLAAARAALPETIAQSTKVAEAALGEVLHSFAHQRKLLLQGADEAAKAVQKLDKQYELVSLLDNVGIRAENPFKIRASQRWADMPTEFAGTRFRFHDLPDVNFHRFSLHKPNDTLVAMERLPEDFASVLSNNSRVTMQYLYSRPGAISPHIHDKGPVMPVSSQQMKFLLEKGDNPEAVTRALFADRTAPAALNLHVSNPAEFTTYHFDRALSMSRSAKPTVIDDQIQKSRSFVADIRAKNPDHSERLIQAGKDVDRSEPFSASPFAPFDRNGYAEIPPKISAKLPPNPIDTPNLEGYLKVPPSAILQRKS